MTESTSGASSSALPGHAKTNRSLRRWYVSVGLIALLIWGLSTYAFWKQFEPFTPHAATYVVQRGEATLVPGVEKLLHDPCEPLDPVFEALHTISSGRTILASFCFKPIDPSQEFISLITPDGHWDETLYGVLQRYARDFQIPVADETHIQGEIDAADSYRAYAVVAWAIGSAVLLWGIGWICRWLIRKAISIGTKFQAAS